MTRSLSSTCKRGLTLRAAWWLHYWERDEDAAAKAVEATGVTVRQAWGALDVDTTTAPGDLLIGTGSDAEHRT